MTNVPPIVSGRWNRFARELEDILHTRNKRLPDLYRAGIYREQVRRLRRSLREPGRFPLLSLAEIDRIVMLFDLTPDEILRLRAALVATATERMLYSRQIPMDAVLQATEEVFFIVMQAMRESQLTNVRNDQDEASDQDLSREAADPTQRGASAQRAVTSANESVREDERNDLDEDNDLANDDDLSELMDDMLDNLDNATLALHLGVLSRTRRDRVRYAVQAEREYKAARDTLSATADVDPIAMAWRTRAQEGLMEAQEQLRALNVV